MAGRASKVEAQASTPTPEAAPAAPAPVSPFGKATTIAHGKEEGVAGIPVESMQGQPFEAGYVDPAERSNPDYLTKLAADKDAEDAEAALRAKGQKAFGAQAAGVIFQPSPNSPQSKFTTLY